MLLGGFDELHELAAGKLQMLQAAEKLALQADEVLVCPGLVSSLIQKGTGFRLELVVDLLSLLLPALIQQGHDVGQAGFEILGGIFAMFFTDGGERVLAGGGELEGWRRHEPAVLIQAVGMGHAQVWQRDRCGGTLGHDIRDKGRLAGETVTNGEEQKIDGPDAERGGSHG